jgi:hypothetical protein
MIFRDKLKTDRIWGFLMPSRSQRIRGPLLLQYTQRLAACLVHASRFIPVLIRYQIFVNMSYVQAHSHHSKTNSPFLSYWWAAILAYHCQWSVPACYAMGLLTMLARDPPPLPPYLRTRLTHGPNQSIRYHLTPCAQPMQLSQPSKCTRVVVQAS